MKKFLLLITLVAGFTFLDAQTNTNIVNGIPSFVYSLPKTRLVFNVEYEQITKTPGLFYQYSQRYLATDQIITEASSEFRIKNIKLELQTVPDANRRFVIAPEKVLGQMNLVLNEDGILQGVNLTSAEKEVKIEKKIIRKEEIKSYTSDLLPLTEEYMLAGSNAKMAEGAAKQIYRIRESRLNILSGELEKLPSDGESLKQMLAGLDNQEQALTSLFVGTVKNKISSKAIVFDPDTTVNKEVLFRFSAKNGLLAADDLSGAPVYLSIQVDQVPVENALPGTKMPVISLNTVYPANAHLTVSDANGPILEKELHLPQLGALVGLPENFFKQKPVKIKLDPSTGRIMSIEKIENIRH